MSVSLIKGQKVDVSKTHPGLTRIKVGLGWKAQNGMDLDASAFLLGPHGKVNKEEDFVFYGNPSAAHGAVVHSGDCQTGGGPTDNEQISIALTQIPAEIEKIAFTITIYDAATRGHHFGQVDSAYVRVVDEGQGVELIRFDLGSFTTETAIVAGELYRYKGEWKFNAIGAGFDGGLAALCSHFGVEVADPPEAAPAPALSSVKKTEPPVPAPASVHSPPIQLSKIELKKKGETISLKKNKGSLGEILVNLNWNQKQGRSTGLFGFGRSQGVDLDLGCLFEMYDGGKGAIQALGESFGSYQQYPYISLDGDDRTGAVSTGENIRINGSKVREIKRILIYAYIYEGIANWAQADGVVTIKQADNPEIVVRLDEHDNRKGMCAIALIENVDHETFRIKRLIQYFQGHRDMDQAFQWNLRWVAGSK